MEERNCRRRVATMQSAASVPPTRTTASTAPTAMEGVSEGGEQRQPEDPRGEEFCVGDAIDFQDNFVPGKWYAGTITKKGVRRYQKEESGPFITYWSFAAKQKANGKKRRKTKHTIVDMTAIDKLFSNA